MCPWHFQKAGCGLWRKSLHAASHWDGFVWIPASLQHTHLVYSTSKHPFHNIEKKIEILTISILVLGWVGRVPLAFMLLTSLLKADISVSRECGRALEPPVKASSKCWAMKGVPFPLWGGGTFRTCGSEPSFIPFISPSTSSSESTAPQLAADRDTIQLYQAHFKKLKESSAIEANINGNLENTIYYNFEKFYNATLTAGLLVRTSMFGLLNNSLMGYHWFVVRHYRYWQDHEIQMRK